MQKKLVEQPNSPTLWLMLIGLLMVALGVYVLFNPITALIALALYLGVAFLVIGAGYVWIFSYVKSYPLLALAIIDIIIGLLFIFNPGLTAATLPIIFAMWALFVGIVQVVTSFELREIGSRVWGWTLLAGILGILFAVLILFYPLLGAITLTVFMGGALIVYGAYDVIQYLMAR